MFALIAAAVLNLQAGPPTLPDITTSTFTVKWSTSPSGAAGSAGMGLVENEYLAALGGSGRGIFSFRPAGRCTDPAERRVRPSACYPESAGRWDVHSDQFIGVAVACWSTPTRRPPGADGRMALSSPSRPSLRRRLCRRDRHAAAARVPLRRRALVRRWGERVESRPGSGGIDRFLATLGRQRISVPAMPIEPPPIAVAYQRIDRSAVTHVTTQVPPPVKVKLSGEQTNGPPARPLPPPLDDQEPENTGMPEQAATPHVVKVTVVTPPASTIVHKSREKALVAKQPVLRCSFSRMGQRSGPR